MDRHRSGTYGSDASPDRSVDGFDLDFGVFAPGSSDGVESTVGGGHRHDEAWYDDRGSGHGIYPWPDLADSLSSEGEASERSVGTVV
eukprot:COSAG02_NODE_46248_length_350_cov_1.027888_1_plen_86_part_10